MGPGQQTRPILLRAVRCATGKLRHRGRTRVSGPQRQGKRDMTRSSPVGGGVGEADGGGYIHGGWIGGWRQVRRGRGLEPPQSLRDSSPGGGASGGRSRRGARSGGGGPPGPAYGRPEDRLHGRRGVLKGAASPDASGRGGGPLLRLGLKLSLRRLAAEAALGPHHPDQCRQAFFHEAVVGHPAV